MATLVPAVSFSCYHALRACHGEVYGRSIAPTSQHRSHVDVQDTERYTEHCHAKCVRSQNRENGQTHIQTDRQTHRTTTVTLTHVCWGLMKVFLQQLHIYSVPKHSVCSVRFLTPPLTGRTSYLTHAQSLAILLYTKEFCPQMARPARHMYY